MRTSGSAQRFRSGVHLILWGILGTSAFGKPCAICLEDHASSVHVDVCEPCMLKYLRQKIDEGFWEIPDPLRVRKGTYNNPHDPMPFLPVERFHSFLASRDKDYLDKLDRNRQRIETIRKGGVPCPCSHPCDGILIGPTPSITCCGQCGHPYQAPDYEAVGEEVRACSRCSGPLIKADGCDAIVCGHCKGNVDWPGCTVLYTPPEPGCTCVLQ